MNKNDYETQWSQEQIEGYVNSINWEGRLKREIPFLANLFKKFDYKNILDLGCGPGKHAIALSTTEDFYVTGIDIDEQMIEFAKKSATKKGENEKVQFSCKNVFENPPELEAKFDALFTLGNALMIIWSSFQTDLKEEWLINIFKSLNYVLRPRGGLFFQTLNSDNPRNGHVVSKITTLSDGRKQMLVKHFIPISSESKLYTTFTTLSWNEDQKPEIKSSKKGSLYLVPVKKLEEILTKAGFTDFQYFDNYTGGAFNKETSDALLCYAIKK